MERVAIILGITGVSGTELAKKLLEDARYSQVISIHRRPSGIEHPKFKEYVGSLKEYPQKITADVLFCCVGTTQAKTPDKEVYRAVDYGIPLQAARFCYTNGIPNLIIISALGANANSLFFYNRIKGEMERDVQDIGVKNTYFLQPSLITGERQETRKGEYMMKQFMKLINPILLGNFKKYRSIHPESIVKAMIKLDQDGYQRSRIPSDEIQNLANEFN